MYEIGGGNMPGVASNYRGVYALKIVSSSLIAWRMWRREIGKLILKSGKNGDLLWHVLFLARNQYSLQPTSMAVEDIFVINVAMWAFW